MYHINQTMKLLRVSSLNIAIPADETANAETIVQ